MSKESKTVVITGASAGIGKAMAFEFAARGYALGLTSRRLEVLEDVRAAILAKDAGARVEVSAIDVSDTESVGAGLSELFGRMGGVDIVVVNAGINSLTKVGAGQLQNEAQMIQTNVIGAIATVHAAVEHFKERGGGHVVGISSLAALGPIPQQAAYCASKAAFSMYLDTARLELGRYGVDVTSILPGFVRTEIVPNMDQYPFIVSAEKAASEIATIVERRDPEGVVPAFPWKLLKPVIGHIPQGLMARLKGR